MTEINVPFWLDDPKILFTNKFFPTKSMTVNQKLNSLMTLSIYGTVVSCVYTKSIKPLAIMFVAAILTIFLKNNMGEIERFFSDLGINLKELSVFSKSNPEERDLVEFTPLPPPQIQRCVEPTVDNPFMNPLVGKGDSVVRDNEACDLSRPEIKTLSDAYFNNNLFRDTSDLFGKLSSARQYYSVPNHDSISFAKWLYKNEDICKVNNDFCLRYEDIRAQGSRAN